MRVDVLVECAYRKTSERYTVITDILTRSLADATIGGRVKTAAGNLVKHVLGEKENHGGELSTGEMNVKQDIDWFKKETLKDRRIEGLQAELARHREMRGHMTRVLEARNEKIDKLTDDLRAANEALHVCEGDLDETRVRRERAENRVSDLELAGSPKVDANLKSENEYLREEIRKWQAAEESQPHSMGGLEYQTVCGERDRLLERCDAEFNLRKEAETELADLRDRKNIAIGLKDALIEKLERRMQQTKQSAETIIAVVDDVV